MQDLINIIQVLVLPILGFIAWYINDIKCECTRRLDALILKGEADKKELQLALFVNERELADFKLNVSQKYISAERFDKFEDRMFGALKSLENSIKNAGI